MDQVVACLFPNLTLPSAAFPAWNLLSEVFLAILDRLSRKTRCLN